MIEAKQMEQSVSSECAAAAVVSVLLSEKETVGVINREADATHDTRTINETGSGEGIEADASDSTQAGNLTRRQMRNKKRQMRKHKVAEKWTAPGNALLNEAAQAQQTADTPAVISFGQMQQANADIEDGEVVIEEPFPAISQSELLAANVPAEFGAQKKKKSASNRDQRQPAPFHPSHGYAAKPPQAKRRAPNDDYRSANAAVKIPRRQQERQDWREDSEPDYYAERKRPAYSRNEERSDHRHSSYDSPRERSRERSYDDRRERRERSREDRQSEASSSSTSRTALSVLRWGETGKRTSASSSRERPIDQEEVARLIKDPNWSSPDTMAAVLKLACSNILASVSAGDQQKAALPSAAAYSRECSNCSALKMTKFELEGQLLQCKQAMDALDQAYTGAEKELRQQLEDVVSTAKEELHQAQIQMGQLHVELMKVQADLTRETQRANEAEAKLLVYSRQMQQSAKDYDGWSMFTSPDRLGAAKATKASAASRNNVRLGGQSDHSNLRLKYELNEIISPKCPTLPLHWHQIRLKGGVSVYRNDVSKVCTLGRPWRMDSVPDVAKDLNIPLCAVPCLYWRHLEKWAAILEESSVLEGKALSPESYLGPDRPGCQPCDTITSSELAFYATSAFQTTDEGYPAEFVHPERGIVTVKELSSELKLPSRLDNDCKLDKETMEITLSAMTVDSPPAPPAKLGSFASAQSFDSFKPIEGTATTIRTNLSSSSPDDVLPDFLENFVSQLLKKVDPAGKTPVEFLTEIEELAEKRLIIRYTVTNTGNWFLPMKIQAFVNDKEFPPAYGADVDEVKNYAAYNVCKDIFTPSDIYDLKIEKDEFSLKPIDYPGYFEAIDHVDPDSPKILEGFTEKDLPLFEILREFMRRYATSTGDYSIKDSSREIAPGRYEQLMKLGGTQVIRFGKSKEEAKVVATQALIVKLHPDVSTWGQLVRRYFKPLFKPSAAVPVLLNTSIPPPSLSFNAPPPGFPVAQGAPPAPVGSAYGPSHPVQQPYGLPPMQQMRPPCAMPMPGPMHPHPGMPGFGGPPPPFGPPQPFPGSFPPMQQTGPPPPRGVQVTFFPPGAGLPFGIVPSASLGKQPEKKKQQSVVTVVSVATAQSNSNAASTTSTASEGAKEPPVPGSHLYLPERLTFAEESSEQFNLNTTATTTASLTQPVIIAPSTTPSNILSTDKPSICVIASQGGISKEATVVSASQPTAPSRSHHNIQNQHTPISTSVSQPQISKASSSVSQTSQPSKSAAALRPTRKPLLSQPPVEDANLSTVPMELDSCAEDVVNLPPPPPPPPTLQTVTATLFAGSVAPPPRRPPPIESPPRTPSPAYQSNTPAVQTYCALPAYYVVEPQQHQQPEYSLDGGWRKAEQMQGEGKGKRAKRGRNKNAHAPARPDNGGKRLPSLFDDLVLQSPTPTASTWNDSEAVGSVGQMNSMSAALQRLGIPQSSFASTGMPAASSTVASRESSSLSKPSVYDAGAKLAAAKRAALHAIEWMTTSPPKPKLANTTSQPEAAVATLAEAEPVGTSSTQSVFTALLSSTSEPSSGSAIPALSLISQEEKRVVETVQIDAQTAAKEKCEAAVVEKPAEAKVYDVIDLCSDDEVEEYPEFL